ncbi:DNA mismatch repair protein MutS [Paraburkholderia monticola]|uniref:DNA mismatch repair protein MutS n=1 Tax=Paraburkholderia monticola TaxID=1399968 RepID=A0A149PQY1_9BURK|nr:DNA mismatch repair protein MutS [Paraburkholderia monticola]KXU87485.1 DNA mismatch repair protein MutS [Paraburkholderia monticola]
MKAHLLYDARDFDWSRDARWNEQTLNQDLELDIVYRAMAAGDNFLYDIARKVVPESLTELDTILYRQAVLQDCIDHESAVRQLYVIAVQAVEAERKSFYWGLTASASSVLHSARDLVQAFIPVLRKLRDTVDQQGSVFRSAGLQRFCAMIREALSDDYFAAITVCLKELKFRHGVLISAQLGRGNKGTRYVLRKPHEREPNLLRRLFAKRSPSRTFRIADRDESGARALSELEARGIDHVANALAQSGDHIKSFFSMLRAELGFYLGCLNLRADLIARGVPLCMPVCRLSAERQHRFEALHDVSLALRMNRAPVGNDADANGKDLIVVTGANQGGKSTFLRSIGMAQVMMQAGMPVGAASFDANIASGIFTHYKREEDPSMRGGKFDEELRRMSEIVDHLQENALLLSNESFASTNEREGSAIGRQIVDALLEKRVKICLVTHLFTLASGLHENGTFPSLFLRAQRLEGGERTFRLIEARPLQTSFGEDVYRRIFGAHEGDADEAPPSAEALSGVK